MLTRSSPNLRKTHAAGVVPIWYLIFLTKVFGSKNERELKQIQPLVEKIDALELEVQALQDEQLKARTAD